jgi:two-component system cell cycle response regulator DivK
MNDTTKKVLIFDDDEDILSICTFVLEDLGWAVFTFSDCTEIIEKVSAINPDVILMDNWIPESGGVAAVKILKNSTEVKHIPVIFFSANSEIAKLTKSAGADTYLSKPFDIEELATLVDSYKA